MHSINKLLQDLRSLGINEGDTVLVRGDLRAVGRTEGRLGETIIGALRQCVGPHGNLMALAFTKNYFILSMDRKNPFTRSTPSTTGALSKLILAESDAVRSEHPTNSFVATGPAARDLMSGHDEQSSCFHPIKKLLDYKGKMLIFGCLQSSPGFTTVHWAQHVLGLDRESWLSGLVGCYYKKNGELLRFVRKDIGGCSMGFGNFYQTYRDSGILREGEFGSAESLCVDASEAFAIEIAMLRRDPRFIVCADPLCYRCKATLKYNKRALPGFAFRSLVHQAKKILPGRF